MVAGMIRFELNPQIKCAQSFLVSAKRAERIGAIDRRICERRVQCQRAIITCQRIFNATDLEQCIAAVVECFRVVGAGRNGPFETHNRFLRPLECAQRIAAIVERFGEIGLERKRTIIAAYRIFMFPEQCQDNAVV